MSAIYTDEQNNALREFYKYTANEIVQGKSKAVIVEELVKRGWSRETTIQFVDKVKKDLDDYKKSTEGKKALAGEYAFCMLKGLLLLAIGIGLTALSQHFIFVGAIIFGIVNFFRGLFGWVKYGIF